MRFEDLRPGPWSCRRVPWDSSASVVDGTGAERLTWYLRRMTTVTPIIIEPVGVIKPECDFRATWFDTHSGGQVQGQPGGTHQEALRNLADALDKEAERRGVIAAIDSTP